MAKEDYSASGLTVKAAIQTLLDNDLTECFTNIAEVVAARDGESTLLAQINSLQAADVQAVKLTGAQTIAGVKTFSSSPVVPTPTTDMQGSTKKYVDDQIAAIPGGFPSGGVIMWSGTIANIPAGWVICDGNNSTPNLTDRFVIHADADSGGTNDVGDTGGSNSILEANLPTHTHAAGTLAAANDAHTHVQRGGVAGTQYDLYTNLVGGGGNPRETLVSTSNNSNYPNNAITLKTGSDTHGHTVSGSTGNNTTSADDFKPKYYALAYIMKS